MKFTVRKHERLNSAVRELVLGGDVSAFTRAGQFAQVSIEGFFLRRPISLCDLGDGTMTLVYKPVGAGTDALTRVEPGETLDVLTGLGNGYDISKAPHRPLVIGGGTGVPPLLYLSRLLAESGRKPTVILGFNSADDIFLLDRFEALDVPVTVTTVDGSAGLRGLVTDAQDNGRYVFACGPLPMLRAVSEKAEDGQFSFEERMGCGFGVCMGCTHLTVNGPKRMCKEGPVLEKGEILWT